MNADSSMDTALANNPMRLTRPRFCGVCLAIVSALFGFAFPAAAARCRKKSDRCDRGSQCCSKRCKRGFCYPRRR